MKSLIVIAPVFLASVSEAPPPGFELWLRNLLYVAGIAWFVWGIIEKARRKPSIDVEITNFATKDAVAKIEVKLPTMATKDELQTVANDLSEGLAAATAHADKERREGDNRIYKRIDEEARAVADRHAESEGMLHKLDERTETHTREIVTINTKLDRILERLPRRAT